MKNVVMERTLWVLVGMLVFWILLRFVEPYDDAPGAPVWASGPPSMPPRPRRSGFSNPFSFLGNWGWGFGTRKRTTTAWRPPRGSPRPGGQGDHDVGRGQGQGQGQGRGRGQGQGQGQGPNAFAMSRGNKYGLKARMMMSGTVSPTMRPSVPMPPPMPMPTVATGNAFAMSRGNGNKFGLKKR